jgi:hydroxymethylpyrimidine pyrophosphatase-like HAD family hydrolase
MSYWSLIESRNTLEAGAGDLSMGNGGPELQEAADAVTASCDDEGFAKAVEQFILGPDRADA